MKTVKRLSMLLVTVLMGLTSCQTYENIPILSDETSQALETTGLSRMESVESLLQRVRNGETDAYLGLAERCRDGIGMPQSNLNALCYYIQYYERKSGSKQPMPQLFNEEHPYYAIEVFLTTPSDSIDIKALEQHFEERCPQEMAAIKVAVELIEGGNPETCVPALKELEKQGSELSVVFQAFAYRNKKHKELYLEYLHKASELSPMFYSLIAECYEMDYLASNVDDCLKKAVEYYYKAEEKGQLTPRFTVRLNNILDYMEKAYQIPADPNESERLRRVAKREVKKL